MSLRVGEWVEVRSAPDILATLDERGCYEGLLFMPQMVGYCGKRFRVSKRAHKLCDTVHGTGARRLTNAVFLEDLRCHGRDYGGCEMECLIFWKEAWLKRVADTSETTTPNLVEDDGQLTRRTRENVCPSGRQTGSSPVYSCQATELPSATTKLSVWDPRQYWEDWRSGNARLGEIASVLFFLVYDTIATAGLGVGALMRTAYDLVQRLRGGALYPARPGKLQKNGKTPTIRLSLQPGEFVTVKDHASILETVTEDLLNRGMAFHPDMAPFCSQSFRVSKSLRRIMNEKTGQLLELKNPCIVLDGVPCAGHFTKPLLCPRGMFPYWREIWLERAESGNPSSTRI